MELIEKVMTPWLMNFVRYLLMAGIPFGVVYIWFPHLFKKNQIQSRKATNKDFWREFRHSFYTTFIIAIIIVLAFKTSFRKFTLVYSDWDSYKLIWIPISILLAMIVHDTYFYWMHRLIHHPRIYKHVHLVHHKSVSPSPLASYSFHILEAILEVLIAPILLVIIPLHPIALITFALLSFGVNVYGHLGYEIAPRGLRRSFLFELLTTSTYHNLHHSAYFGNYGLYFRVWDRVMGTENPAYVDHYDAIQTKRFGSNTAYETK